MIMLLVLAIPARAQPTPKPDAFDVKVTGVDEQAFPKISVQFEVVRPDGAYLRDAEKKEFQVTEEGREVPIVDFQAPITTEMIPTTLVLVVDHSGSMEQEGRIVGLKRAVASFLEKLPAGSRVAVVSFANDVDILVPFTTRLDEVRHAVDGLEAVGATRFFDAVDRGLALLKDESGRRAVLALTDGMDTDSYQADLGSLAATGKRLGLPIYTLGLGSEREIRGDDLKLLAESTRGQYYPARRADELRTIYERIAERIGSSYVLTYQTDRAVPDGTLRPIRISFRDDVSTAETSVFIPGMVAPAGGWSLLFLGLTAALTALLTLPSRALIGRSRSRVP